MLPVTRKKMPRIRNDRFDEVPLPDGWDVESDVDGKVFFIDHNTQQTTWVDPRDRLTKPATFADCLGDELPYGWEQAFDPKIGTYFINHLTKINQIEDPRLKWRDEQEKMLREYLADANQDIMAKRQILSVKNERLALANEEVQNLTDKLAHWKASGTSLNSASSSSSAKYDPDLLRADIADARNRVVRLKQEQERIRAEMQYKEKGLETLKQVNSKMVENQSLYNVDEAQAVMRNISELNKSLMIGVKEKQELLMSLARLKEDLLRTGLRSGSSPDISTLLLPQERTNAASQTDLSGECINQFGELLRLRLQYNEAKNSMHQLQMNLAHIESQLIPGQMESDRDQLILIDEKDQLLRELQSLNMRGRSSEDVAYIQSRIMELDYDLRRSIEQANQQMAINCERRELNQAKCEILRNLAEIARTMTLLEMKIKTLSMSTTSISSGSSLGSLGSLSASSKGSQSSVGLSYADIYSADRGHALPEVNLPELYRRVERLLQGHQNFNSIPEDAFSYVDIPTGCNNCDSGFAPIQSSEMQLLPDSTTSLSSKFETCSLPSYEEHMERQRSQNLAVSRECISEGLYRYQNYPPNSMASSSSSLSAVAAAAARNSMVEAVDDMFRSDGRSSNDLQVAGSLTSLRVVDAADKTYYDVVPMVCQQQQQQFAYFTEALIDKTSNPPLSPISESSSSGVCNNVYYSSNAQSISAAVSEDSITGSDSGVSESNILYRRSKELDEILSLESAQIQVRLQYIKSSMILQITIEQAKNLSALHVPETLSRIYFKVSLLPSRSDSQPQSTRLHEFSNSPVFGDIFSFAVGEDKLYGKTVKVLFFGVSGSMEEMCCGVVMISLASFNSNIEWNSWYNILSVKFIPGDLGLGSGQAQPSLPSSVASTRLHLHEYVNASNVEPSLAAAMSITTSTDSTDLLQKSIRGSDPGYYQRLSQSSRTTVLPVKEESSDESTVISSQTSTLTRNHANEGDEDDDDDDQVESPDEREDDEDSEQMKEELSRLTDVNEEGSFTVAASNTACFFPVGQRRSSKYGYVFSPNYAIAVTKCDKETNTDPTNSRTTGRLSRQSHDMMRGSTIRRWQTFSPTAAGLTEEELSCKLSRSGSDSSVRHRKKNFERHAVERQSIRLKKSSPSLSKSVAQDDKLKNRTSIDLELDLQAHRMQLVHLNEEILSLKELKRKLEESKEKGETEPVWLVGNEPLKQFLIQTDKMLPHRERKLNLSNVDEIMRRRLRKARKEAQQLQVTGEFKEPDEVSFRRKMAFFTTMTPAVPVISYDNAAATSAVSEDSTSAPIHQFLPTADAVPNLLHGHSAKNEADATESNATAAGCLEKI